ncbi:MAG: UDP-N-acetylglucosamine--N-acetylmuramyl-(pentapeptide) pyrophosphoryl-undecaprenol N-acetylglucosamine transferase [Leptonema sp. (in: Bacteria)]|nr:UDP-N-acetylglucosamine--N-acetylmuramyl-(pentapeptide) pyrophosphoryl-undecaprenol N-acetylglucosamine transferase [Leptonema sp. (in: bacteria)]
MSHSFTSILIVAGGTGGHISPGLSLAEESLQRNIQVTFLSIPRNRNYSGFVNTHFQMEWYEAPALQKNLRSLLLFIPKFIISIFKAAKLLQKTKIRSVIVLGGYPSMPAAIAAILLRRQLFVCEQNAVHGKVTRILSRFAKLVFLTFEPITENQNTANFVVTGNPIRQNLKNKANSTKSRSRQLPKKPTILVLGGSQGAVQINEMIFDYWSRFTIEAQKLNWIVQAGEKLFQDFQLKIDSSLPTKLKKQITIFGFDADIYRYFEKADLCFSRAGAGNITESAVFGLPMILLPYPFAADNHQLANAKAAVKAGAAVLIDRKDTNSEELKVALRKVIDITSYKNMSESSLRLGRADASIRVLNEIQSFFGN